MRKRLRIQNFIIKSRALKDSPRISQEQRERIKAFAREHNFYPNAIAESLRQSKTRPSTLIGVIIPQINHYYFSSILAGIEEQAYVRGYSVVVAQSGEQYEREVRICESFMHSRVCGVIVSQAKDTTKYEHFQELLSSFRKPRTPRSMSISKSCSTSIFRWFFTTGSVPA